MKKKLSVIISVICIIVSLGSISGTLYYAKNHNTSSMMQQTGGTPPSMPSQGDNRSQDNNQSDSQQNNESNQQDSSEIVTKVQTINQIQIKIQIHKLQLKMDKHLMVCRDKIQMVTNKVCLVKMNKAIINQVK